MKLSSVWVVLAIGLLSGCGDDESDGGTPNGNQSGVLSADVTSDFTVSGDVRLTKAITVASGATLTIAAGTTIAASSDAGLIVKGALVAKGTADEPVVLRSADGAGPGAWAGIAAAEGGSATLDHTEIHEAAVAFRADPGSMFAIDHILIDTSASLLVLGSDGTLAHGELHNLGADQSQPPVAIESASPTISDTLIDQANDDVDIVVVNGASSGPIFDHVEITDCHCAFHFNAGSGILIKDSYIHGNEFGIMTMGSLETAVEGSNFENNGVNIGVCAGGSIEATGVYFDGAAYDDTCTGQGNTSPASAPVSGAGPRL